VSAEWGALRRTQSALRQATERFAAEIATPADSAPDWSEFEWVMAQAASVLHGITPLLASSLRWGGSAQWRSFAAEQLLHTAARHRRIVALLAEIERRARADGIGFIALKGAALHALGLYSAGQRPMSDIDLLVREGQLPRMSRLLEGLGYCTGFTIWKHVTLEPIRASQPAAQRSFGENEHAPVKIDLHTHIAERLPAISHDITELMFAQPLRPGLNPYPSSVALMLHLSLHAAGNLLTRSLRLIQLHDIALLARRFGANDWSRLMDVRLAGRGPWWALPPLLLVQRYYGGVPSEVLKSMERDCPPLLRRSSRSQLLSDVSYAAIHNQAFPGLVWSRSLSELLTWLRIRVHPGPEQLSVLQAVSKEPWAAGTDWYQIPRARRALRWLYSRTPRPAVMYIVDAATAAHSAAASACVEFMQRSRG
jgi:hypothetical protein